LPVYEATRNILASVYLQSISEDDIRVYGLRTLDAKFLFDDQLYRYLSEIHQRVAVWNDAKSHAEHSPPGDEEDEFERIQNENLNWIRQQGGEESGFASKFESFLAAAAMYRSATTSTAASHDAIATEARKA
jgi:hypothetical protein